MRPNPWPLLRRLARRPPGESDPVSDADLLVRFARDRDQAAFELLVWRHGPMVFGVCRRILRDAHLAEDAFQAAFLILARKAESVRADGSVAGWLHRVTKRVALRAAKQRKRIEPLAADPPGRPSPAADEDLRAILDAEIDRLPDRFRLPVVLCYLDGRTTEAVAKLLGVPRGTVLSRLATARQKLAARLTRRGIAAPAALAAVAGSASEVISTDLVEACVSMAVRFVSGMTVPGVSVQLAEGVLRMGFRNATAVWATAMLATAAIGTGIAVTADGPVTETGAVPVAAAPAQPDKPPPAPKPVEREKSEQERQKELAVTIDQLQAEREKLNAQADKLQQLIASKQREELHPHVIQAMGAVLTEAELTIFRTELELRGSEQRVEELRRKLKAAEDKPIPEAAYFRVTTPELGRLRDLEQSLAQATHNLSDTLAKVGQDHPTARKLKEEVTRLIDEKKKATADARTAGEKALREENVSPIQRQLAEAESDLRRDQRTLETARERRDEIVTTLYKANDQKQAAEIQRLDADLQANRETARQLSRLVMELELKLKGLPVPDATRSATSDDRLDRVLRELSDLRVEVRRLGGKK